MRSFEVEKFSQMLSLLKDKSPQSIGNLSNSLLIEPNKIISVVSSMSKLGIPVQVYGQSISLKFKSDFLDSRIIEEQLSDLCRQKKVYLRTFELIDSTNDFLISEKTDASKIAVVLSEIQTQGRGRRGKFWQSPFGSNIYMSIKWNFDPREVSPAGLSLVIGIAVSKALWANGLRDVKLKWPNDVIVSNKKIGGILTEIKTGIANELSAVIGLGINFKMPAGSGKNIDQPWTDMCSETNARINRNEVVACLINTIVSYLEEFRSFGFDAFWESWNEIDFLKNKKGVVSTKDGELLAKFNGITDQGALKIITDTGDARILHSGEVSVRVK